LLIFQKQPSNYEFFLLLGIFYTLIVLSFIDFKYKAVPSYLLIIVVIFALLVGDTMATFMFMGGFVLLELVTTFYIQTIKARITDNPELESQRALGEGDIPIAGVIGGLLGIQLGVTAIFVAAIIALIPAIYNLFGKQEIQTPFIPFLSLGLLIVYISEFNLFGLFV
jgi:leader peptidase (prepilin peptidase)/N-methyltransferase